MTPTIGRIESDANDAEQIGPPSMKAISKVRRTLGDLTVVIANELGSAYARGGYGWLPLTLR